MENIKKFLKKQNFFASKKMGQNFLINQNIILKIFNNIPNLKKYDCILEIGPGLGALTDILVKCNKKIISVELDKRLYDSVKNKFINYPNLSLINDNFLDLDLQPLLNEYKNVVVIANIPYSITTPIILKCLNYFQIKSLYIMVQKEVAEKWNYLKTSNRNASTNIINYYFDVKKLFLIDKRNFFPCPKVDSTFVLLNKKNFEKYNPKFYDFIKCFFKFKRKKILNNIPKHIDKNKFSLFLKKLGYNMDIRAEILTYTDWQKIFREFNKWS